MKTTIKLMLIAIVVLTSACKKKSNVEQDQYIDDQLKSFQENIVGKFELTNYSSEPNQNLQPKDYPYSFIQINEASGGGYLATILDKNNASIAIAKASLQARTVKEQQLENNYSAKLILDFNETLQEYIIIQRTNLQFQLTRKREQNGLLYNYTYLLTKK